MVATEVSTKTEVFTKEELDELRKRLNQGRNGTADYTRPPQRGGEESDDWKNDVSLLAKFVKDLRDVLRDVAIPRFPEPKRKQFLAILENLQDDIDDAVGQLEKVSGPKDSLWDKLKKVGLYGDALLAKLDEFRDAISGGPLVAVLDLGDKILGSLTKALPVLEPFKEAKELVEHRIKYGADDETIRLGLY